MTRRPTSEMEEKTLLDLSKARSEILGGESQGMLAREGLPTAQMASSSMKNGRGAEFDYRDPPPFALARPQR